MKIFRFEPLANYGNDGFCFSKNRVKGIGNQSYKFKKALALEDYPSKSSDVTLKLDDDHDGLRKGSFLGNTSRILIGDKNVVEVIKSIAKTKIDYHPFTLLDHKDRVHSQDYVMINPLEVGDYWSEGDSEVEYDENGDIDSIWRWVMDKEKTIDIPPLFRTQPASHIYFMTEEIVDALNNINVSNFVVREIEVV